MHSLPTDPMVQTPIEKACAELLERQAKRTTLHLRFGSAMNSTPRDGRGIVTASGE